MPRAFDEVQGKSQALRVRMAIVKDSKPQTQLKDAKDYRLQKAAQNAWSALCSNPIGDVEGAVKQYMREHPKLKPEAFSSSGSKRTRLAWYQLRGKRKKGVCHGGSLGRLRVLAGEPLELRRISFNEVGLEALERHECTQFVPNAVAMCFDNLEKHAGCLFWAVLEFGGG